MTQRKIGRARIVSGVPGGWVEYHGVDYEFDESEKGQGVRDGVPVHFNIASNNPPRATDVELCSGCGPLVGRIITVGTDKTLSDVRAIAMADPDTAIGLINDLLERVNAAHPDSNRPVTKSDIIKQLGKSND